MQVAWVTARRYLLVIVEVLPVDDRCTLTLRLGTLCIFSTTSACCVGRVGLGRLLQPGLAREVLLLLQPHIWQVFIIVLAARKHRVPLITTTFLRWQHGLAFVFVGLLWRSLGVVIDALTRWLRGLLLIGSLSLLLELSV